MKSLRIAITGAGIAGLTAASFLARDGHAVTLFERFETPKPVGAGLLLQPTGLSVLALLGLDQKIIACSSRIDHLDSRSCGSNRSVLDVRYRDVAPHLFGLGVQRGNLFLALYEEAKRCGATFHTASEMTELNGSTLRTAKGQEFGPFDLVIDASGARSALREKYASIVRNTPYPYGALWAVIRNDGTFPDTRLSQRVKQATHMIGVLPVGSGEAAFFYSLRVQDYDRWKSRDIRHWQEEVITLWPETEPLIAQMNTPESLTLASYSDTVLRRFHQGRLVFIGDAAHCTSPQLGQGGNLALMDAWVLSRCISAADSLEQALQHYETERRDHIRFYQTASRLLTPFFQSDSKLYPLLRSVCSLGSRTPPGRKIAAQVLCGTKTGIFASLNPGEWASDYSLFTAASNT